MISSHCTDTYFWKIKLLPLLNVTLIYFKQKCYLHCKQHSHTQIKMLLTINVTPNFLKLRLYLNYMSNIFYYKYSACSTYPLLFKITVFPSLHVTHIFLNEGVSLHLVILPLKLCYKSFQYICLALIHVKKYIFFNYMEHLKNPDNHQVPF